MIEKQEHLVQLLERIKKLKDQVRRRQLAKCAAVRIVEKLENHILKRQSGNYDITVLNLCFEQISEMRKEWQVWVDLNIFNDIDDSDLVAVLTFLRHELDKFFTPVELPSINATANQLDKSELSSAARQQIILALEKVYAAQYTHTRLDALLELSELCSFTYSNLECLQQLRNTADDMIKIICNAANDEELKERLRIRNLLIKYKPDFITLPPKRSPVGELLRDLLNFETSDDINKPTLTQEMAHKAFAGWNGKTTKPKAPQKSWFSAIFDGFMSIFIDSPEPEIPPTISRQSVFDKDFAIRKNHFSHPRKLYLALLTPYFIKAIARKDIRPVNHIDASKDFYEKRTEYSDEEVDRLRLYPYRKTRMLLNLEHHGFGRDKTIRFYPFNTHTTTIQRNIINRALLVMTPCGSIYAAKGTTLVTHSSIAHTAYFSGYVSLCYGRINEVGSLSKSFRTISQNAFNFYRHLKAELGPNFIDTKMGAKFFLDNQHSKHLLRAVVHLHLPEVYRIIKGQTYEKAKHRIDENFYTIAELHLNRRPLNTFNEVVTRVNGTDLPLTKIKLAIIRDDFPEINNALTELKDLSPKSEDYVVLRRKISKLIRNKLINHYKISMGRHIVVRITTNQNIHDQFNYKLVRAKSLLQSDRLFQQIYTPSNKLERLLDDTYDKHFISAYLHEHNNEGRIVHESTTDFFINRTLLYKELLHEISEHIQHKPGSKMRDFMTAKTNIYRAKSKKQKFMEELLTSRLLGIAISTIILGAYTSLFYLVIYSVFTPGTVATILALTTSLTLITSVDAKEEDISWGYVHNITFASFAFLLALIATPPAHAIAIPAAISTLLLPATYIPIVFVHLVIRIILDYKIENRIVDTKKYNCSKTKYEEIKADVNAHKLALTIFYKVRDYKKQHKIEAAKVKTRDTSMAPGSTIKEDQPTYNLTPKHTHSPSPMMMKKEKSTSSLKEADSPDSKKHLNFGLNC